VAYYDSRQGQHVTQCIVIATNIPERRKPSPLINNIQ
jgi:hypothetical protein